MGRYLKPNQRKVTELWTQGQTKIRAVLVENQEVVKVEVVKAML
jgi:hypothetical protein